MNYIKKALMLLNSIRKRVISFDINYYIYRTVRIIEKWNFELLNKNNSTFQYRKQSQDFKLLINKLSLLYYDFFSLLLNSKFQNNNSFNRIYKIGVEIMNNNPKIEESYQKLINIKTDNVEIIKLYSQYVEGVLWDEEKLEKCQNDSKMVFNLIEIHEKDFSNFDIDILNEKGNLPYIIVSGHKIELGKIIGFSLNILKIFGYTKNELIGQYINILIPRLFHKIHDILVIEQNEKDRLNYFDEINKRNKYLPNFIKKDVYGITKMKFLIELSLNIYFVKTEKNKLIYIVEIENYNPTIIDLIKNVNSNTNFCVLTDENFLIHSFTANCLESLKLTYTDINSNFSIINYIKQFQDDYLNAINNSGISKFSHINKYELYSEERNSEQKSFKTTIPPHIKKKIKNELFIKKYSKKCKITWRKDYDFNLNTSKIQYIRKSSQINIRSYILNKAKTNTNFDEGINLYMEIKKIIIKQELLGYYFYFSTIKNNNYNNMSYIIDNKKNDIINNNNPTKIKKYQCTFQMKEIEDLNMKKGGSYCSLIIKGSKSPQNKDNKENNKNRNKERKKSEKGLKINLKDSQKMIPIKHTCFSSKLNNLFDNYNSNIDNNIMITDQFIPEYSSYFLIDLNTISFNPETDINKNDEVVAILKKQANSKIQLYQDQLKLLSNDSSQVSSNESEEYEDGEDSSESSDSNSNSFPNSFLDNTKYQYLNKSTKIIAKTKIYKNQNINKIEYNKSSNKALFYGRKISKKNSLINNFYKVNLNNIHFLKYDFYKDMIVEGNKNEIVSKIESIMMNSNNVESIEKDERFSFVSRLYNKNKKTNKENKDNNQNIAKKNDINSNVDNNISEEKIFKKKIYEALNKHKDEPPIIKLKLFIFLSYFVMLAYEIITTFLYIKYLLEINKTLYLIKNTIFIKYCSQISVYYLREMTLLNFEVEGIKGGNYYNYPDKEKESYKNLIKEEIMELYVESLSSMKVIFSSSLTLNYNSTKFLSEYTLNIKMSRYPTVHMNYKILIALMQYTSSFYNLASSSTDIEQNHSDLFNYIYNNLNDYKIGINILINMYINELEIYLNKILILAIISGISIFIFFCVVYIIIIKYFLSALQIRGNYMKTFYGINENILKNIINNCEKLINKLKSIEEKRYDHEKESLMDSLEEKTNLDGIQNNQKINSQNLNINNDNENQEENKASLIGILFLIIYGFFSLITYLYYIFNAIYVFNISKRAILVSKFCFAIETYHLGIIEFFNIYREFLFDNESIINNMTSFDYLIKYEKDDLSEIYQYVKYINTYYNSLLSKYEIDTKKSLCNYYINDYFDSSSDCEETIGLITNYDFDSLAYNFFEEIKINKNVIKYILKKGIILGNLTEYNYSDYINNPLIPRSKDDSDNTNIFRLELFNNNTIHANLNIMFFNIILPFIEVHRKKIYNILNIDGIAQFLIVITVLFQVIVTLVFLCYFIPVINYINSIIYKTKNMLSIIPLNILSLQSGVSKLLKISSEK